MGIILGLASLGTIFLFVILSIGFTNEDDDVFCVASVLGFIFLFAILVTALVTVKKPSAIDVYQGKTTLEITYKNDIPIDSVVVFK